MQSASGWATGRTTDAVLRCTLGMRLLLERLLGAMQREPRADWRIEELQRSREAVSSVGVIATMAKCGDRATMSGTYVAAPRCRHVRVF